MFIVVDRWKGIQKAFNLAQTGDVVVITAKGTEPFIAVANGQKFRDDRSVAREILEHYVAGKKKLIASGRRNYLRY